MTRRVSFTVPGLPIAEGRGRAYNGRVVTPSRTRKARAVVAQVVQAERPIVRECATHRIDGPRLVRDRVASAMLGGAVDVV